MSLRARYAKQRAAEEAEAPPKVTETAIGEAVVHWLTADGWTVYQEVKGGLERDNPVADIVATRGPIVYIVECKVSLSQDLLDQCIYWSRRGFAHYVSCAHSTRKLHTSAEVVLDHFGIGSLLVRGTDVDLNMFHTPRMVRGFRIWQGDFTIARYLHEDQRTRVKAGSKGGNVSTPFQRTCDELRTLVESGPVAVKEAIAALSHHYQCDSSARSSLVHWASQGGIRGIKLKREGRRLYFAKDIFAKTPPNRSVLDM